MPVIVQVCVVIVTIAVVALVIALVRMADRLSKLTEDIRVCLVEVREVTGEAKSVVATAREVLQPVPNVAVVRRRPAAARAAAGSRHMALRAAARVDTHLSDGVTSISPNPPWGGRSWPEER